MKKILHLLLVSLFLLVFQPATSQNSSTKTETNKEAVVYITKTGSKYHSANCGYLHSSKIAISLDKAQMAYDACSRCNGSPSYRPKSKTTSSGYRSKPTSSSSTAVQCSGTTKAGNRCKRRTKSASGRCYQH